MFFSVLPVPSGFSLKYRNVAFKADSSKMYEKSGFVFII